MENFNNTNNNFRGPGNGLNNRSNLNRNFNQGNNLTQRGMSRNGGGTMSNDGFRNGRPGMSERGSGFYKKPDINSNGRFAESRPLLRQGGIMNKPSMGMNNNSMFNKPERRPGNGLPNNTSRPNLNRNFNQGNNLTQRGMSRNGGGTMSNDGFRNGRPGMSERGNMNSFDSNRERRPTRDMSNIGLKMPNNNRNIRNNNQNQLNNNSGIKGKIKGKLKDGLMKIYKMLD